MKTRRRRPKVLPRLHGPTSASKPREPAQGAMAIQRALDVLECFPDGQTNLNMTEIREIVGLNESTLFRILLTLEGRGYLHRNGDGSYELAPKLLFGRLYERSEKVRQTVHSLMEQLTHTFNENTSLKFLFEDKIQTIDFVSAFQEIGYPNYYGKVLPPNCSSAGKAITAYQPKEVMERILQCYGLYKRTENTITDPRVLMEEYEQIRQRRYAVDREESHYGGICFAAPLFDRNQRVIAALSICSPAIRMNPQREKDMIEALISTAGKASLAIQSAL